MNGTPVTMLDLTCRARNVLRSANIHTIEALADTPDIKLLALRSCGRQTLRQLRRAVENKPLPKAMEVPAMRDWFAGQALASMAHPKDIAEPKISATLAYQVADAMLAEREKA